MNERKATETEQLKHRYRVREIVLDKGILTIILALLTVFANARLEEYKAGLDAHLDDLRASRERQRVIAEREVTAYENIWKALIDFRRTIEPFYDEPLEGTNAEEVTKAILDFEKALAADSIYLTDPLRTQLNEFIEVTFPDAYVEWELAEDPRMPPGLWSHLDGEMDDIGREIRTTIYNQRRHTGDPS